MPVLSNKSLKMNEDHQVTSSRTKLYALQIGSATSYYGSGGPSLGSDFVDGFTISLKNGSDAGDILFKTTLSVGKLQYWDGQTPHIVSFGSNYILFEDGMFAKAVGGATETTTRIKGSNVRISFIYEGA